MADHPEKTDPIETIRALRMIEVDRDRLATQVTGLREAVAEAARALSRISYLCGEPNEQGVSAYDVAPSADMVVAQVERLADALSCSASPYGVHRCCHCDSEVTRG